MISGEEEVDSRRGGRRGRDLFVCFVLGWRAGFSTLTVARAKGLTDNVNSCTSGRSKWDMR